MKSFVDLSKLLMRRRRRSSSPSKRRKEQLCSWTEAEMSTSLCEVSSGHLAQHDATNSSRHSFASQNSKHVMDLESFVATSDRPKLDALARMFASSSAAVGQPKISAVSFREEVPGINFRRWLFKHKYCLHHLKHVAKEHAVKLVWDVQVNINFDEETMPIASMVSLLQDLQGQTHIVKRLHFTGSITAKDARTVINALGALLTRTCLDPEKDSNQCPWNMILLEPSFPSDDDDNDNGDCDTAATEKYIKQTRSYQVWHEKMERYGAALLGLSDQHGIPMGVREVPPFSKRAPSCCNG